MGLMESITELNHTGKGRSLDTRILTDNAQLYRNNGDAAKTTTSTSAAVKGSAMKGSTVKGFQQALQSAQKTKAAETINNALPASAASRSAQTLYMSSQKSGDSSIVRGLGTTLTQDLLGSARHVDKSSSLDQIFEKAASATGLSSKLLKAVAKQESGFKTTAVSKAGAMGVMQLMPATARSLGVSDPFDAEQNIMGGAKYLAQQLPKFGGSIEKALAAYNAARTQWKSITNSSI